MNSTKKSGWLAGIAAEFRPIPNPIYIKFFYLSSYT